MIKSTNKHSAKMNGPVRSPMAGYLSGPMNIPKIGTTTITGTKPKAAPIVSPQGPFTGPRVRNK